MSSEDLEYYAKRAIVERRRAEDAPSSEIAHAHEKLAVMYENLIERLAAVHGAQDSELRLHIVQPSDSDTQQ